jgi:hypothetical protein
VEKRDSGFGVNLHAHKSNHKNQIIPLLPEVINDITFIYITPDLFLQFLGRMFFFLSGILTSLVSYIFKIRYTVTLGYLWEIDSF